MHALLLTTSFESLLHISSTAAAPVVSALFSAAWEGTVLAVAVVLSLRLLPRLSAAARSVIWMNVFLLLVLLHVLPLAASHIRLAAGGQSAHFQLGLGWCLAIAILWVSLSLFRAAQLISDAIRLRGLAKRATAVPVDESLQSLLQLKTAGGRVVRSAGLCTSTEVHRPSVFGFFHPRILVPPALLDRLTALELEQVVLHEMEHLRRGDDWTNLLQKLALVLFPLNPAMIWVENRLCAERELACDDKVLRSNCGRKAYAICLTHLAEYSMLRRGVSLALGAWEKQSELVRRVHRILRRPGTPMSARQTAVMTAGLMAGVLAATLGLARSPRLVEFATPGPVNEQAVILPPANLQPALTVRGDHQGAGMGAHAELLKAVVPANASEGSYRDSSSIGNSRPGPKKASLPRPRRQLAARPRSWVVMTQWSTADVAPSVVFTVQHVDPRSGIRTAYAAVPTPDGWLFIQI